MGLTKAGLNSGVVLISSGLNSDILPYAILSHIVINLFAHCTVKVGYRVALTHFHSVCACIINCLINSYDS